jgi:hypothetical protein
MVHKQATFLQKLLLCLLGPLSGMPSVFLRILKIDLPLSGSIWFKRCEKESDKGAQA